MRELRQVIAELELVSQLPAVSLKRSAGDSTQHPGGKRPPGGLARSDDYEPGWKMKSAEHFRRRLRGARTDAHLRGILGDAKDALDAWRRQPAPSGEPEFSSPQWKRWVAESDLSLGEIARKYNCSRAYIQEIRRKYGAVA